MRIKITIRKEVIYADFEENETSNALIAKMPMTFRMLDLFGREKCHNFLRKLPCDNVQMRGYEVGEIVYWPPMHSFVVLYGQNGEHFEMQSIGKLESGTELFASGKLVKVKLEVAE